MKLLHRPIRRFEEGNILFVCLVLAGIAGVTLAGFLMMTQNQNVSIYRSQNWNSTMAVSEAGIEDGLQLVNKYAGTMKPGELFKWTNNVAADGWETLAPNLYHVKRYLPISSTSAAVTNYYEVWITNLNNTPYITSSGTVPWTYQYASAGNPAMFAAIGAPLLATAGGGMPALQRNVYVACHYDPLFVVAMAALGNIDLNGQGVASDSFDSSDPAFSNNGKYPTGMLSRTRANGDICTDANVVDSFNYGNAKIKGHVRTGPGVNTFNGNANASIGDRTWVEGGSTGIQPGWSSTDFNVRFDKVILPADYNSAMPPGIENTSIAGTDYQYVITNGGNWYLPSTLTKSLLVDAPAGSVVNIFMNQDVNLTGSDVIRITATGAQVLFWMYGGSFSLSGSAWIDNMSGNANNFYLFGTAALRTINFGGNGNFYGAIYAPQADFYLGGGGANTYDFVGGSVTKTVHMNGHFNFHFDENLAKVGPAKGFIPVAWQEI